jgi:hypothetical protein
MTETQIYFGFAAAWSLCAVIVFAVLLFIPAPYGRFARPGWGPTMGHTLGWIIMEAPSALLMAAFFAFGNRQANLPALVFLFLWQCHYVHRAFVYPFTRRDTKKSMTLVTVLLGVVFNAGNAYLNGRALFYLMPAREAAWLTSPAFIIGLGLFVAGFVANRKADARLRALRKEGGGGYAIPRGGLFERVSAANYFGELVEWVGWAVLTWSLGGLVFAWWTAANLIPRARTIHRWYLDTFPDYPKRRKAIVPFLF